MGERDKEEFDLSYEGIIIELEESREGAKSRGRRMWGVQITGTTIYKGLSTSPWPRSQPTSPASSSSSCPGR